MKKYYRKWLKLFLTILVAVSAYSHGDKAKETFFLESLDYAVHYEIILNASPEDIWPYILDLELWLPFKVVHVEGEKNRAGELKYITTPNQSVYLKVLNIIPFKHFSNKRGVNSDGVGPGIYGHMGLTELDGKTKLNLDVFSQVTIVPTEKNKIDVLRETYVEKYLESIEKHFLHLKNLVEMG